MAESSFKLQHPLERRQAEATRIRDKYRDRIPDIVEMAERSDIPDIDKKKMVAWFTNTLQKQLVIFTASIIFVLVLLFHQDFQSKSMIYNSWYFGNEGQNITESRQAILHSPAALVSLKSSIRSLVRGEDIIELESTGFSCNIGAHSEECVIAKPITLQSQTIWVQSNDQDQIIINRTVRPYARREDEYCMQNLVSPIQILPRKTQSYKALTICQINHNVPAIIFSFGGYSYNHFHAINDIIIPLFITSRNFGSEVKFFITDYNATRVNKYKQILKGLSSYEIVDGNANEVVHCFPSAVVGLRYHDNLAVNNSKSPRGHTIESFRQFLRETYKLKRTTTFGPKMPKLLLLSRQKSRKIFNEDAMVKMMVELGFQVRRALPDETSNLENFAQIVNSCDMIIGAHGAGLTNQIFLPNGSLVIQIVPMALEWQSLEYFAKPAIEMGFRYLEYKIEPNETTLYDLYGPNDPVIYDPDLIWAKGWVAIKPIYVDQQNFEINLTRFQSTLIEALHHFDLLSL